MSKKFKSFNQWCKDESPLVIDGNYSYDSNTFTKTNPPTEEQLHSFIDHIKSNTPSNTKINLAFPNNVPSGKYEIDDSVIPDGINNLTVNLVGDTTGKYILRNLEITNCQLTHGNTAIEFINCKIKNLALHHNPIINLIDTKIGTMDIQQAHQIHMKGGCVLNFKCPVPDSGTNPFTGSITFKNVFFPKNRKEYLLEGPQPYRNIRHHLRNIENGMMANLFHSAELAVEREDDTLTNKVISYLYQIFSDFGSSAGRPIGWWFILGFIVSLTLFYSDGAVPAFADNVSMYPGWKSFFIECANRWQNQLGISTYLSFQNMLNPLGLLGSKSLVVPNNGWLATLLAIQGLMSAILIALMIFAIRRRFKMG